MKRLRAVGVGGDDRDGIGDSKKAKKATAMEEDEIERGRASSAEHVLSDDNLLWEVLKRVDGRTLALAACVSRMWRRVAEDDRLWEMMSLKDGTGNLQLRFLSNVVTALGGFRRLYSLHLWPLVKPPSPSAPSFNWPSLPPPPPMLSPAESASGKRKWGKDEMNLSLSLLSIRHFKNMDFNNRSKQT